jgi:hypothetical protein
VKHKWGAKTDFPLANKSERTCLRPGCGVTKVNRPEHEGGMDRHWSEFWRGEERIDCMATPPCEGQRKTVTYDTRTYPL